ncbi:hypothetical protein EI94DRAFT_1717824 [Lactarius quietus]|nr:hypothetical protein EI94DRAFT_1717824 [Lactarius quietus]
MNFFSLGLWFCIFTFMRREGGDSDSLTKSPISSAMSGISNICALGNHLTEGCQYRTWSPPRCGRARDPTVHNTALKGFLASMTSLNRFQSAAYQKENYCIT